MLFSTHILKSSTLLICLGFIWGLGYALAKFAITSGVSPLGYSFWQALGSALILSVLCVFRGTK